MRTYLVWLLVPVVSLSALAEIPADPFLRSQLLLPEHARDIRTYDGLWLNDKFRLGMVLRARYEQRENNRFSKKADRDFTNFVGQVSQLWLLARPTDSLSFKVTYQDNRLWGGSGHPPGDTGQLGLTAVDAGVHPYYPELREAFLVWQMSGVPVAVNLGRQVFFYGDARLIGPRNWLNGGNTFDGVRLRWLGSTLQSDLFAVAMAEDHNAPNQLVSATTKNSVADKDVAFLGNYNTWRFYGHQLDAYLLGLFRSRKAPDIPTQTSLGAPWVVTNRGRVRDQLVTLGLRFTNRPGNLYPENSNWDYTLESALQTGFTGEREFLGLAADDITPRYGGRQFYRAWFGVLQGGYTFAQKLRLGGQLLYASGDNSPYNRERTLFNALFGNRHGIYPYWSIYAGESDGASLRNMFLTTIHTSWKTDNFGTFYLAMIQFRKAVSQDDWYGPSGKPMGITQGGSLIYREADLSWVYYNGGFVTLTTGFSILYAGDAVKNYRGADFDPLGTFWYLMVNGSV